MLANLENSTVATGLEKFNVHSNPKGGSVKKCSNYQTIVLISNASKVMLKILHARLQKNMNWGLPYDQLGLEKAEEPAIKLPKSTQLQREQRNSRETSTSASVITWKVLTVWYMENFDCVDDNKLENSYRDGNTRPHLCFLIHPYDNQEQTVRTLHQTTD